VTILPKQASEENILVINFSRRRKIGLANK
jgi:hypothetical protein